MSNAENRSLVEIKDGIIYQGETLVLSDVNINVNAGEFAYLIGKTGTGKSSLLKILYGELPLAKGEGYVCGYDLQALKTKEVPFLRRKLGIVFQDFQLLMDRTVKDNLKFVLEATGWNDKQKVDQRISEVLSQVGLQNTEMKMPHQLSGGEQQRVVIARAILNEPELIIADEPTGNLDPETSDEIMKLIFRLNKELNTAVLMATHDYNIIEKFAARIMKCTQGQIVDEQDIIV